MNCDEFNECVCECVDRRLSKEKNDELMDHARACPHCYCEFQSLASAKYTVGSKLKRESVPSEIYYAIVNATINRPSRRWLGKVVSFKLNPVLMLVALAVVAVGVYSLFDSSSTEMSDEMNIVSQSLQNYQAVIGGSIQPQLVSTEDDVHRFLENEVTFDVIVPKMKGCNSCAGVLSEFKGVKLAHVVYQVGEKNIIYIYQASMSDAMDGRSIGLPDDIKQELKDTDWYIRELPDNTTIVMWRYKNTLCSAVSNLKKEEMIALLTEKELN